MEFALLFNKCRSIVACCMVQYRWCSCRVSNCQSLDLFWPNSREHHSDGLALGDELVDKRWTSFRKEWWNLFADPIPWFGCLFVWLWWAKLCAPAIDTPREVKCLENHLAHANLNQHAHSSWWALVGWDYKKVVFNELVFKSIKIKQNNWALSILSARSYGGCPTSASANKLRIGASSGWNDTPVNWCLWWPLNMLSMIS